MATAKCRTQGFRDRWVCHGDFVHFLHTVVGMNTLIDVSARTLTNETYGAQTMSRARSED